MQNKDLIVQQNELINPEQNIALAKEAVTQLTTIIRSRKDKVIVNGKLYPEFKDWQLLGMYFGITAKVDNTEEMNEVTDNRLKLIGFKATASAIRNGQILSTAEMECTRAEPNWTNKPRFQIRSMAETRACAKSLRNVLSWVFSMEDSATEVDGTLSVEEAEAAPAPATPEVSEKVDMIWLREEIDTTRDTNHERYLTLIRFLMDIMDKEGIKKTTIAQMVADLPDKELEKFIKMVQE